MNSRQQLLTPRMIIQLGIVLGVVPLLPMLISGRWLWWEAWAYAAVHILGFIASRWLAVRRHPGILAERARMTSHENAEPWDRILGPLLALGSVLILAFAGAEARLDPAPGFGLPLRLVGLLLILLGYALGTFALMENRFFSGVVRIQEDRGHTVVSSGPYRWLRHPGYLGVLMSYVATPLLLGTPLAFIPVLFLVGVIVVRTWLEDRTLAEKLAGYRDYTRRVRYRLLPGIW